MCVLVNVAFTSLLSEASVLGLVGNSWKFGPYQKSHNLFMFYFHNKINLQLNFVPSLTQLVVLETNVNNINIASKTIFYFLFETTCAYISAVNGHMEKYFCLAKHLKSWFNLLFPISFYTPTYIYICICIYDTALHYIHWLFSTGWSPDQPQVNTIPLQSSYSTFCLFLAAQCTALGIFIAEYDYLIFFNNRIEYYY